MPRTLRVSPALGVQNNPDDTLLAGALRAQAPPPSEVYPDFVFLPAGSILTQDGPRIAVNGQLFSGQLGDDFYKDGVKIGFISGGRLIRLRLPPGEKTRRAFEIQRLSGRPIRRR